MLNVEKETWFCKYFNRPSVDSISALNLPNSLSTSKISLTVFAFLRISKYFNSKDFLVFNLASTSKNCSVTSEILMFFESNFSTPFAISSKITSNFSAGIRVEIVALIWSLDLYSLSLAM